jgi:hypothetical protein
MKLGSQCEPVLDDCATAADLRPGYVSEKAVMGRSPNRAKRMDAREL